jgi:hypothetical protein
MSIGADEFLTQGAEVDAARLAKGTGGSVDVGAPGQKLVGDNTRCFVGEQFVHLDLIELTLWILVETAAPDITGALTSQNMPT